MEICALTCCLEECGDGRLALVVVKKGGVVGEHRKARSPGKRPHSVHQSEQLTLLYVTKKLKK
jgi:hypothetical protein